MEHLVRNAYVTGSKLMLHNNMVCSRQMNGTTYLQWSGAFASKFNTTDLSIVFYYMRPQITKCFGQHIVRLQDLGRGVPSIN
jgi:hypothetical protein